MNHNSTDSGMLKIYFLMVEFPTSKRCVIISVTLICVALLQKLQPFPACVYFLESRSKGVPHSKFKLNSVLDLNHLRLD